MLVWSSQGASLCCSLLISESLQQPVKEATHGAPLLLGVAYVCVMTDSPNTQFSVFEYAMTCILRYSPAVTESSP
jgi:hypothetical protein